jgi:hypothetical protein
MTRRWIWLVPSKSCMTVDRIATIGYGLADALPAVQGSARTLLVPGLRRLMSRDPFADRLTFAYDLSEGVWFELFAPYALVGASPGLGGFAGYAPSEVID